MLSSPINLFAMDSGPSSKWQTSYETYGYTHIGSEYERTGTLFYTYEYWDYEVKDKVIVSFYTRAIHNNYYSNYEVVFNSTYSTQTSSTGIIGVSIGESTSGVALQRVDTETINISDSVTYQGIKYSLIPWGMYQDYYMDANVYSLNIKIKEHYTKCEEYGWIWDKDLSCGSRQIKYGNIRYGFVTGVLPSYLSYDPAYKFIDTLPPEYKNYYESD